MKVRRRDWVVATLTSLVAIAALVVGSTVDLHPPHLRQRLTVGAAVVVLVVFGVIATRRFAAMLDHLVGGRTITAAGAAIRLLATGVGYVFVFFATMAILQVSVERLLVGAGLASVVLGIAAQQSLGNVFAGFVLLFARPFVAGEHIRIRSGALGGIFDGTVVSMSLTYVTIRVADGVLKIPNSTLLAAGVGPFPDREIENTEEASSSHADLPPLPGDHP